MRLPSAPRRLRIAFESPANFQREFDSNLCNGGAFVRTEESFELRDGVEVELCFDYSGKSIVLEAEVVHTVPPEMAEMGTPAGVAVQFQLPIDELRNRLSEVGMPLPAAGPGKDPGRRNAPRRSVRVPAQIRARNDVVSGQTRDLSLTGVLVGVKGHGVPLGEPVQLVLEHPTTGRKHAIEGRVARHVETHGEISAVAVEFTLDETEREATERFVEELQGVEHTRRLGGISGPIEELGPRNLLQMFAHSAPRGTLVLRCDQQEGVICFEGSLLRLAQLGSTTGMDALVRMLGWREGVFEFHARIDEGLVTDPPFPLEAALADAVSQIDEGQTARPQRFPLHGRLVRIEDADLDAYGSPSKVEGALIDLAGAGFTLQRALELIPESDPEIFRALQALIDAGILILEL